MQPDYHPRLRVVLPPLKLFPRFYSQYKPMEPLTRPESYTVQDRPFRPLALCTALLGAWFILYGGAAEWQQIVPGIILLLLALRLFSRVRPTVGDGVGRLGWLVRSLERGTTRFMNESETEEEHYHQGTVIGELAVLRFHRRLAFHVAMLLRGPQGAREDHHASVRRVHYLSHYGCSVGGSLLGLGH